MRPELEHENVEIKTSDKGYYGISNQNTICCVPSCRKKFKRTTGMGFSFPNDEESQKKWLIALGMSKVSKCSIVCHIHFKPEHFVEGKGQLKKLQKGIVPIEIEDRAVSNLIKDILENNSKAKNSEVDPLMKIIVEENISKVDPSRPENVEINLTETSVKDIDFDDPLKEQEGKCCVPKCRKIFVDKPGKAFEFPDDQEDQEKWLKALRMGSFSKSDKVCFRHFMFSSYSSDRKLPKGVIPIPISGPSNPHPDFNNLWLESLGLSSLPTKKEPKRSKKNQTKKKAEKLNNEIKIEPGTSGTQTFIKTEIESFATESEMDPLETEEMDFVGVIPRNIELKTTKQMFPCQYCKFKFSEMSDKTAHENGDACFVKKLYQESIQKSENRKKAQSDFGILLNSIHEESEIVEEPAVSSQKKVGLKRKQESNNDEDFEVTKSTKSCHRKNPKRKARLEKEDKDSSYVELSD